MRLCIFPIASAKCALFIVGSFKPGCMVLVRRPVCKTINLLAVSYKLTSHLEPGNQTLYSVDWRVHSIGPGEVQARSSPKMRFINELFPTPELPTMTKFGSGASMASANVGTMDKYGDCGVYTAK